MTATYIPIISQQRHGMNRSFDLGFFSSADRGLDVLLDMIPEIEKRLGRKVTSTWAYGWNIFDQFHKKNAPMMKWKWKVVKKMHEVGMVAQGRLSHEDLAKLMFDVNVWAYPVSFPEIHCITALKAQAAGCQVVTSGYAALQETVFIDEPEIEDIHNKPEELNKFIDRIVKALKEPRDEDVLHEISEGIKEQNDWSKVAEVWDKVLT